MVNYNNGKIYCIRSSKTDLVYIGSTTLSLEKRFSLHKTAYKKKVKRITSSTEIMKYDDCYIELLLEYPCNTKKELFRKEGEYIKAMNCVNRCVAGRTVKEYRQDYKEDIDEYQKNYMKMYYLEHKNDKKDYDKKRCAISYKCACGGKYRANSKKRHERSIKHISFIK